ncbi:MAG: polypeptide subunit release factor methylase [Chlamydiales bacterium]|jgi:methylase of polypeptide subunit release factors
MAEVLAASNFVNGQRVLELGAGTGNQTIVMLRQGARELVATEIREEFLEATRRNIARNCPDADNIEYRGADWLDTEGQFDVLVSNPPFCKSGKQNRRYFIDSLALDGHKRLVPRGTLLIVQSSMADLSKTLMQLDDNGFDARVIDRTRGLFRDYYFEDKQFMREIEEVADGYELEHGKYYECSS